MKPTEPTPALDGYLRQLRWALGPLPQEDRDEILAETRSLLLDRQAGGADLDQVLADLGPPETYARGFLETYAIATSVASGSPWRMLSVATRLLGHGIGVFLAIFAFFFLYATSLSLGLVAVLKPVFPERVGLWTGDGTLALGFLASPTPGATEHLGYAIIPLALAAGLALFWLTTILLRRFLQRLRRPLPGAP